MHHVTGHLGRPEVNSSERTHNKCHNHRVEVSDDVVGVVGEEVKRGRRQEDSGDASNEEGKQESHRHQHGC